MKPVCVPCKTFLRPKRNGTPFIEGMPRKDTDGTEKWKPYKLWLGDLWECESCGAQIIVGVPEEPIAEHYQTERFAKALAAYTPLLMVEDC